MVVLVDSAFCNEKKDGVKEWITVKGVHIPVKEGQTKKDAVDGFVDSKKKSRRVEELEERQDFLEEEIRKLKKRGDRYSRQRMRGYEQEYDAITQRLSEMD